MSVIFIRISRFAIIQQYFLQRIYLVLYSSHRYKATPIYLLVLRAQEVGNEPFWNKKKVEKCDFFYFLFFFRV